LAEYGGLHLPAIGDLRQIAPVRMVNGLTWLKRQGIAVENEVADNMYERSELDYLIYNEPLAYADLILNGDPETYLKTVAKYKPLD